jgi:predicted TPR repeat methyltransferase
MTSTKRTYFDKIYQGDADPWSFESSEYEQRKYAVTMASLPKSHYGSVFEPGCSIGVLTRMLASRCDRLLATDVVPAALDRARRRVEDLPHVVVERRAIPEDWPEGSFDLVVLSEIAYYFDAVDLASIVSLVARSTQAGGHLVGVHWRGATDYPLSGDGAHKILAATPQFEQVVHHIETDFVLGVWERGA